MKPEKKLDELDKEILRHLGEDGRMSVKQLTGKLSITSPTLQSRIKQLTQSGVLKIAGLVNTFEIPGLIPVIVAARFDENTDLEEKMDQITQLDEVHSVCAVTGRYDVFIEVLFSEGIESLYDFMFKKLPEVGNIDYSESFVVMKSKKKWTLMPPQVDWPTG